MRVVQPSQRFILRFLPGTLFQLLTRLKPHESSTGLATAVLRTLGELSVVESPSMQPLLPHILPSIIEHLNDHASPNKREVALHALGQVAGNTGHVIEPYKENPALLMMILGMLRGRRNIPWSLRREV